MKTICCIVPVVVGVGLLSNWTRPAIKTKDMVTYTYILKIILYT